MLGIGIIVFREVLEAALVISVILAATHGVDKRWRWVSGGIGAGLLGAVFVAGATQQITQSFSGIGQELFNAAVLFGAVGMLAWHNIWMASHARQLTGELKRFGGHIKSGDLPIYFLATAIGLAVLREGSEVVLFTYGFAAADSTSWSSLITGIAVGLLGGIVVGGALYFGLLRIPTRQLFRVTGWMILLLASGMAAGGVGYLMQAGILPAQPPLWSTAGLLSQHSIPGEILHVLVGYLDRPTALQVGAYLGTLSLIGFGMYLARRAGRKPHAPTHTPQLQEQR